MTKTSGIRIKVTPPYQHQSLFNHLNTALKPDQLIEERKYGWQTHYRLNKLSKEPTIVLIAENKPAEVDIVEIGWLAENEEDGKLAEKITKAIIGSSTNALHFQIIPDNE